MPTRRFVAGTTSRVSLHWAAALICCLAAFAAQQALANDFSWNDASGGIWNTPGDWTPTGVPSSADSANFGVGLPGYTVTMPAASGTTTVGRLAVGGAGELNLGLNGQSLQVDQRSGYEAIAVGDATGGHGNATITNGTIGVVVNSSNPNFAAVHVYGGSLTLNDGGAFEMAGGAVEVNTASLTFDGAGTTGNFANTSFQIDGALHIQNGAVLETDNVPVAFEIGSTGTAAVTGAGSQWNLGGNTALLVQGSLTVGNGATITPSDEISVRGSADIQAGGSVNGRTILTHSTPYDKPGSLIVDGTINGGVTAYVGVLSGTGLINGVLNLGGATDGVVPTIAPGGASSPGTLTANLVLMSPGTVFQFNINSATGTAGGTMGWNLLSDVTVAAIGIGSASNPIVLSLQSLTTQDAPGMLADFDPHRNYHWAFLTAALGIGGFSPADFKIDTSGFTSPILGQFSVSEVGNNLVLNYVVPEPSTFILAGIGLLSLSILALRRHRCRAL